MTTTSYHLVVAPDGRGPEGAAPELAAVRLISLLPPGWHYEAAYPSGTVSLHLTPPRDTPAGTAYAVLAGAFADPILRGWTWTNRAAGAALP